jgi:hypothetical protein
MRQIQTQIQRVEEVIKVVNKVPQSFLTMQMLSIFKCKQLEVCLLGDLPPAEVTQQRGDIQVLVHQKDVIRTQLFIINY